MCSGFMYDLFRWVRCTCAILTFCHDCHLSFTTLVGYVFVYVCVLAVWRRFSCHTLWWLQSGLLLSDWPWQTTHQFELDILAVTAYVSIRLENYCREVVWMGMHSVRLEMASKVVVPHMSEVWARAQRVYSPLCEVVFKPQKTVKAMLMKVKEKVLMEGRETLCMWSTSVRRKNNEKETDETLICCEVGRSVE